MDACDAIRIFVVALVVMLFGLGVSGCGKSPEGERVDRVTMSVEEVAMFDLVRTYLLEKGGFGTGTQSQLWVEGIMTVKGPWSFRVVRIDNIDSVVVIGTGALDTATWRTANVQPAANQVQTALLPTIHDFALPSSETALIRNIVGTTAPLEFATAVLRRALALNGWHGGIKPLHCIWFEGVDGNGWVAYHFVSASQGIGRNTFVLITGGRVNLKTGEVQYNPGVA